MSYSTAGNNAEPASINRTQAHIKAAENNINNLNTIVERLERIVQRMHGPRPVNPKDKSPTIDRPFTSLVENINFLDNTINEKTSQITQLLNDVEDFV